MGPSPPIVSTGYAVQRCCRPRMLPSTDAAPPGVPLSFSPTGRTGGSCGAETRLSLKGRGLPPCPGRSFHNASLGLIGPHTWSPVDTLRLQQTLSGKHGRTQADTLGLQHKSFHRAALLLHSPPALQSLREGSESPREDRGGVTPIYISTRSLGPQALLCPSHQSFSYHFRACASPTSFMRPERSLRIGARGWRAVGWGIP